MVILQEIRIPLPFTVEEYKRGQLYTVIEASRRETNGDTAVEIIANEPFKNERGEGQYTHKRFHLGSKVPRIVAAILPETALILVEKAWNAYPICRTEYSNPWLGERFNITIESIHLADNGSTENAHNLNCEELKQRKVTILDIGNDDTKDLPEGIDPRTYKSELTGRGPLEIGWMKNEQITPIMCCYKLITIKFQVFGLQGKVEDIIQKKQMDILLKFHKEVFCLLDKWYGLSIEDIRIMEDEIKIELAQRVNQMETKTIDNISSESGSGMTNLTVKSTPY